MLVETVEMVCVGQIELILLGLGSRISLVTRSVGRR